MGRKPISKTLRFEVFKRDKFTCQYCGSSAPDVILEVDHITPVSKGGDNSILNLITSCRDCNRGKTNKTLSDNSAVVLQRKQLENMQERREQLEMMVQWRNLLDQETEIEVESIDCLFQNRTKWGMSDVGKSRMKKNLRRFGFNEVYKACEIAIDKYYDCDEKSWNEAFNKVGGICYNRQKAREN